MTGSIVSLISILVLLPVSDGAQSILKIDPSAGQRPIGLMNGVNGGPCGVIPAELYKAAKIPFARFHDVGLNVKHCVELMEIFPDFDADETRAENYDFAISDQYVKRTLDAGVRILWRFGDQEHQSNEIRKYGAWPPRDFAKWARICEHVIRHYNEGWADGFNYNIGFWEIWNEPDGDQGLLSERELIPAKDRDKVGREPRYKVAPHSWGGTMEEFYTFYSTVFKHLKKCFPDLKIGGPANSGYPANEPFIKAMKERGVKVDFFSWHMYGRDPENFAQKGTAVRALLDRYGWNDVPSILDEWNYQSSWDPAGVEYSKGVRRSIKGSAFVAALMCRMQQEATTDILFHHSFHPNTTFNGSFNRETGQETATYYVFLAWSKLLDAGTQVAVSCEEKDIYSVAAKDKDGRIVLLLSRYNDDDSVQGKKTVLIPLPEGASERPYCLLSDSSHTNCAYPFMVDEGGRLVLKMEPNSIISVEFQ